MAGEIFKATTHGRFSKGPGTLEVAQDVLGAVPGRGLFFAMEWGEDVACGTLTEQDAVALARVILAYYDKAAVGALAEAGQAPREEGPALRVGDRVRHTLVDDTGTVVGFYSGRCDDVLVCWEDGSLITASAVNLEVIS